MTKCVNEPLLLTAVALVTMVGVVLGLQKVVGLIGG